MSRYIIIHYSEIGLKKSNKEYFVKKLIKNIQSKLDKRIDYSHVVRHILSRIVIEIEDNFDQEQYTKILNKIFAIRNYQFAYSGSLTINELGQEIWDKMPSEIKDADKESNSFKVRIKKSQKMDFRSNDAESQLGAILLKNGLGMSVKMKDSDFTINVEIFNNNCYFSYFKYSGLGGMSSSTGDKAIALISSGIDSPVAAFRMMKRGIRIIFIHFHSYPFTDMSEIENVEKLVDILSDYQMSTTLYLCPFGQIQKEIASNLDIDPKIRVILYRRMMIRIAERIAGKKKAKGIITGDSFAQVASQTAHNLYTIHDASTIPLYQPLISYDKEEIIKIAREIGTFDISKLPCKDTCSMFMPEHPELASNVFDVRRFEELLPIKQWLKDAVDNSEKKTF